MSKGWIASGAAGDEKERFTLFFQMLRKRMKAVIIVVSAAFVLTLLYIGGGSYFNQPPPVEAVAVVNGEEINEIELNQVFLSTLNMYRQFGQQISRIQEDDLRFSALRQLIDRELMYQAAEDEKIRVDRSEIDERIDQIRESVEAQGGTLQQALQREGMTLGDLRDLIRKDLMVQGIQEAKSQVEVTDEEVRKAHEESLQTRDVRHILVRPEEKDGEKDWEGALEEARALEARIRGGENFAALAKEHSDDPGSAAKGGSLGPVRRDDSYVPEFLDAVFALGEGELSEPVRSQYGYHLIEVTDIRTEEGEPFEEVADRVRQDLERTRGQRQLDAWLEELRAKAEIDILLPELRAIQLVELGRLDQAIAQFRAAIEENPEDPYLHYRLAQVLEQVEASDEALAELEKATEHGSFDPQLWFTLGMAYQEREMKEEAKEAYLEVSELSPNNLAVHSLLAGVFEELGYQDLAEAEKATVEEIRVRQEEAAKQREEELSKQEELQRQLEEARRSQQDGADGATEESAEGQAGDEAEQSPQDDE